MAATGRRDGSEASRPMRRVSGPPRGGEGGFGLRFETMMLIETMDLALADAGPDATRTPLFDFFFCLALEIFNRGIYF